MEAEKWREIVSGSRVDIKARCLLLIFRILAVIYGLIITVRNLAYRNGVLPVKKAELPVISVGNITAGGTGKTPIVIWLCQMFAAKNLKTAVLSRGYKGDGQSADEPELIRKSCPESQVIINSDRFAGSVEACKKLGNEGVLILDDGFQHRRLGRELDILTVDATCPFGYERILPAGLLRESLSGIKRAKIAIITRCDIATEEQINFVTWRLIRINPDIAIYKVGHRYSGIEMLDGKNIEMPDLSGKKCFVFCGIGNPHAFLECLFNCNVSVVDYKIYADHHNYTVSDAEYLLTKASDCDIMLTTEKDFVKLKGLDCPELFTKCGCTKLEIDLYGKSEELSELIINNIDS